MGYLFKPTIEYSVFMKSYLKKKIDTIDEYAGKYQSEESSNHVFYFGKYSIGSM